MQLQRVPGEPPDPGEVAAAALAARGIVLISGKLTAELVDRVTAQVLTTQTGERMQIHLTNVTGSLRRALVLHDVIAGAVPRPAITASGQLDTAGAVVLAAAAPGERSLTPNASIHLTRVDGHAIADDENELAHLQLDAESAAAEATTIKQHVEQILGRSLDRPALLQAGAAVDDGIADKISLNRK